MGVMKIDRAQNVRVHVMVTMTVHLTSYVFSGLHLKVFLDVSLEALGM